MLDIISKIFLCSLLNATAKDRHCGSVYTLLQDTMYQLDINDFDDDVNKAKDFP